jgi:hypothetical protein
MEVVLCKLPLTVESYAALYDFVVQPHYHCRAAFLTNSMYHALFSFVNTYWRIANGDGAAH